MKKIIFLAALAAFGFSACKKKQPESIPQPKTGPDGQAAAVSTGPAVAGSPLAAPGNYLETTVGRVGEAKAAKALFEKTAVQQLDSLDLNKTGGN